MDTTALSTAFFTIRHTNNRRRPCCIIDLISTATHPILLSLSVKYAILADTFYLNNSRLPITNNHTFSTSTPLFFSNLFKILPHPNFGTHLALITYCRNETLRLNPLNTHFHYTRRLTMKKLASALFALSLALFAPAIASAQPGPGPGPGPHPEMHHPAPMPPHHNMRPDHRDRHLPPPPPPVMHHRRHHPLPPPPPMPPMPPAPHHH